MIELDRFLRDHFLFTKKRELSPQPPDELRFYFDSLFDYLIPELRKTEPSEDLVARALSSGIAVLHMERGRAMTRVLSAAADYAEAQVKVQKAKAAYEKLEAESQALMARCRAANKQLTEYDNAINQLRKMSDKRSL